MGKKLVVELTNRCNLHCQHCFSGRHGGHDDLPLAVLQQLLDEAYHYGFDEVSFTGGDPTVYPHLAEALARTTAAGYHFALNTNGWNFAQIYPILLPYLAQLTIITFSLDGATATTHERLRGHGSWRHVMQAMSICMAKSIPFSINMVLTTHNQHEIAAMIALAARLGARGLRFGHLLPTPATTAVGLDLSPAQRHAAEAAVRTAAPTALLPVVMAPGYHTTELFPCDPLQGHEVNVNCHGEMTLCCHLSGHGDGVGQGDVVGKLAELGFGLAFNRLVAERYRYRTAKQAHAAAGTMTENDFFPCWYCARHYHKVDWLQSGANQWWPITLTDHSG